MTTSLLTKADFARAKAEALWLLRRFKIAEPPVNPIEIARNLNIGVSFVELNQDLQNISGFYEAEEDCIFVNVDEAPVRQTFTIAHELGHRILHLELAKSSNYNCITSRSSGAK